MRKSFVTGILFWHLKAVVVPNFYASEIIVEKCGLMRKRDIHISYVLDFEFMS